MENELHYYLNMMKAAISSDEEGAFKPTYLVTAVKLPTGAIELATNICNIAEKIDYILEAYDENMCLKTNPAVQMMNIMVV